MLNGPDAQGIYYRSIHADQETVRVGNEESDSETEVESGLRRGEEM